MTDEQVLRAIGEQLLLQRARLQWSPRDVRRRGGPTIPTIQTIEAGQAGTLASLLQYCKAVDLPLEEVLRNVVRPEPLSPDVQQLLRLYGGMSPRARNLLSLIAEELAAGTLPGPPKNQ